MEGLWSGKESSRPDLQRFSGATKEQVELLDKLRITVSYKESRKFAHNPKPVKSKLETKCVTRVEGNHAHRLERS